MIYSARAGSAAWATERVERRLTAILAADVAAYSRLMGADEEGTRANASKRYAASSFGDLSEQQVKKIAGSVCI
jgi:class 3 adenylate cyclase